LCFCLPTVACTVEAPALEQREREPGDLLRVRLRWASTSKFDVRERFFAELDANPTLWEGKAPVDQEIFDRNHARSLPERGLDERTLWALATARTNRAELFGVQYSIVHKSHALDSATNPHAYIQIEEFYHTRILKDVLATLGIEMEVGTPSFSVRTLVKSMTRLPDDYANVMVLCGEIFGAAQPLASAMSLRSTFGSAFAASWFLPSSSNSR
jgi:hypothetical protein